jgi:hypothetical protein
MLVVDVLELFKKTVDHLALGDQVLVREAFVEALKCVLNLVCKPGSTYQQRSTSSSSLRYLNGSPKHKEEVNMILHRLVLGDEVEEVVLADDAAEAVDDALKLAKCACASP